MSIYDVDYNLQSDNLNNPRFRLPNVTTFLHILMKPLQWIRDNLFNDYLQGSTQPLWADATVYAYGARVQYGFSIYECQLSHTSSLSTGLIPSNQIYWYKIQDNFIGLNERFAYTGQKLIMEYALNRQFQVTSFSIIQWDDGIVTAPPYTQIYITNTAPAIGGFFISPDDTITQSICPSDLYTGYIAPSDYNFTNNYWFIIHVPSAIATAINVLYGQTGIFYQSVIRSVADKYVESGKLYNIVTY